MQLFRSSVAMNSTLGLRPAWGAANRGAAAVNRKLRRFMRAILYCRPRGSRAAGAQNAGNATQDVPRKRIFSAGCASGRVEAFPTSAPSAGTALYRYSVITEYGSQQPSYPSGCPHRTRSPEGIRPGPRTRVLFRSAGISADAAIRIAGGIPQRRRIPPPYRPEYVGKFRWIAATAR